MSDEGETGDRGIGRPRHAPEVGGAGEHDKALRADETERDRRCHHRNAQHDDVTHRALAGGRRLVILGGCGAVMTGGIGAVCDMRSHDVHAGEAGDGEERDQERRPQAQPHGPSIGGDARSSTVALAVVAEGPVAFAHGLPPAHLRRASDEVVTLV